MPSILVKVVCARDLLQGDQRLHDWRGDAEGPFCSQGLCRFASAPLAPFPAMRAILHIRARIALRVPFANAAQAPGNVPRWRWRSAALTDAPQRGNKNGSGKADQLRCTKCLYVPPSKKSAH